MQPDDGPAEHIVLRDHFFFMVIVVPVPQLFFILLPVDLIPAAQTIIVLLIFLEFLFAVLLVVRISLLFEFDAQVLFL